MIRLLSLDIDGTILDSHGQLPPANREAIARVEAALREANNGLQEETLKFRQDALAELTKASGKSSTPFS